MNRRFLIGIAGALLLASPTLAAVPVKDTHKMRAEQPSGVHRIANVQTQGTRMTQGKREIMRAYRPRVTQGDREVSALNSLEAAGYRNFDNLRASGHDFVATATKAGKTFDVTVLPSGKIQGKSV
jgi:hypothetical protein